MWDSVAHYKEIPSGASEPIAWDRCNYSDNIREPALPAVLSPRLEKWGLGWGMQLPCPALHFLHLSFCLLSFSPRSFFHLLSNLRLPLYELIHIFFPLSYENTCSYIHPYLALFVKQNLFQWDGNQMKEITLLLCSCWLCFPTPHSLLTVSPKQDRCSVCMLPAFPISIFLPGIPDYCSICLILVSEFLLFAQCNVLEVSPSIQMSPSETPYRCHTICEVEKYLLNPKKDLNLLSVEAVAIFFYGKACYLAPTYNKSNTNCLFSIHKKWTT